MIGMDNRLFAFMRECLDEDERVALAAAPEDWQRSWEGHGGRVTVVAIPDDPALSVFDYTVTFDEGSPNDAQSIHIARHDPARVLAEVEAKRQLIALVESWWDRATDSDFFGIDQEAAWKLLAVPYADRPGYREEWKL